MLKINADRPKGLSVQLETEGLDNTKLEFTFRLMVEGIEYGFPCPLEEDKVSVRLPALSNVIKNLKPGIYEAKLEVNDDTLYLCPFEEKVQIEVSPKIKTIVQEETIIEEPKKKIKTKAIVEEIVEEKIVDKNIGSDISKSEFF